MTKKTAKKKAKKPVKRAKNPVGPPKFKPTKKDRMLVSAMTMCGTTQAMMARCMKVDAKTLRKHFRDEMDLALVKANANVCGAMYKKAVGGDVGAQRYWLATRAGFKETSTIEHSGIDGEAIQTQEVGAKNFDDLSADELSRLYAEKVQYAGSGPTRH